MATGPQYWVAVKPADSSDSYFFVAKFTGGTEGKTYLGRPLAATNLDVCLAEARKFWDHDKALAAVMQNAAWREWTARKQRSMSVRIYCGADLESSWTISPQWELAKA